MSERRCGLPWGSRFTKQVGATRTFSGEEVVAEFSNPGRKEAVLFRGKLYKKLENGSLVLYSEEELSKLQKVI